MIEIQRFDERKPVACRHRVIPPHHRDQTVVPIMDCFEAARLDQA
jgi:hypothetical protein